MSYERERLCGVAILAVTCFSCATASYRIPGEEVQRLAMTDVSKRGQSVRVVPPDESTRALAAPPEVVRPEYPREDGGGSPEQTADSPAPAHLANPDEPGVAGADPAIEEPAASTGPGLVVEPTVVVEEDVIIGADPSARSVARRPTEPPPFHPVITAHPVLERAPRPAPAPPRPRQTPVVRGAPSGAPVTGGPVFTPLVRGTSSRSGFGGTLGRSSFGARTAAPPIRGTAPGATGRSVSRSGAARTPSLPARRGGGGGRSSSMGTGDVVAVVVAVVVVVGIIAAIAAAAEPPPPFDGWVALHDQHPLHLRYAHGVERVVKLKDLRPIDLVGLRDTLVSDADGTVHRLREAAGRMVGLR